MHPDMPDSKMPVVRMPNIDSTRPRGLAIPERLRLAAMSPGPRLHPGWPDLRAKRVRCLHAPRKRHLLRHEPAIGGIQGRCVYREQFNGTGHHLWHSQGLGSAGLCQRPHRQMAHSERPGEHGSAVNDGDTDNNPGNTIKAGLAKDDPNPLRLNEGNMKDPKLVFSVTEKATGFMVAQVKAGRLSMSNCHTPPCTPAVKTRCPPARSM